MSQDDITKLQARIDELEAEQDQLRDTVARAQLEQWEGRIDDLEVQLHLGGMELRDRLEPIVQPIRDQLADTRRRIDDGAASASEAAAALRTGVEAAWEELRSALSEAKKSLT
jgi:hypothetical protein